MLNLNVAPSLVYWLPTLPPPEVPRVAGWCPMGCGSGTLRLLPGGLVGCAAHGCPDSLAVWHLLTQEAGRQEHLAEIRPGDYTVLHPLAERLEGALLRCPVAEQMTKLTGPPREPGLYRVAVLGGSLILDEVDR